MRFSKLKINNLTISNNLATDKLKKSKISKPLLNYEFNKAKVYGAIFSKAKKGISPVVATSLLLVVAVVSVVFFQGWFNTFSSGLIVDIDKKTSLEDDVYNVVVEGSFGNELYLKSNKEDVDLESIKVYDLDGKEVCKLNSYDGLSNFDNSGLVGYWKFDNNSKYIYDYSGLGNDGLIYGETNVLYSFDNSDAGDETTNEINGSVSGASFVSSGCLSGSCLYFDGADDYVQMSSDAFSDYKGAVSVWFNEENFNGGLFTLYDSDLWRLRVGLQNLSNDLSVYVLMSNHNGSSYQEYLNFNVTDIYNNGFNHLIFNYDFNNSKFDFYLNSKLLGKGFNDMSYFNTKPNNMYLGAMKDNDVAAPGFYDFFGGIIDEFSTYSKFLTSKEIIDMYNLKKAKYVEFEDGYMKFTGKTYANVLLAGSSMEFDFPTHNISIFAKARARGVVQSPVGCNFSSSPIVNSYRYGLRSSNGFFAGVDGSTYWVNRTSGIVENFSNKFDYVAFTKNGNTLNFYKNGFLKNSTITPEDHGGYTMNANLIFGSTVHCGWQTGMIGEIDEVMIFNRVLNSSEIEIMSSFEAISNEGINKVDLSRCELEKNKKYNVVGVGNNSFFDSDFIYK